MIKKVMLGVTALVLVTVLLKRSEPGPGRQDCADAINTIKTQMRVPADIEIKIREKKESPIVDFYAIKLMLSAPDRDIPVVVYVDKEGERVIIGTSSSRVECDQKEAGQPKAEEDRYGPDGP